jgi:hypothetical protein
MDTADIGQFAALVFLSARELYAERRPFDFLAEDLECEALN